jgi:rhodanese-related sulfurtransferase
MEIDTATAKRWMDRSQDDQGQEVFFLDCREPNEHQVAHVPGVTLVPMSQWPPSQGGRSLRVTQWLRANGYPDAMSMSGGIDRWSVEIDPSVPRY